MSNRVHMQLVETAGEAWVSLDLEPTSGSNAGLELRIFDDQDSYSLWLGKPGDEEYEKFLPWLRRDPWGLLDALCEDENLQGENGIYIDSAMHSWARDNGLWVCGEYCSPEKMAAMHAAAGGE